MQTFSEFLAESEGIRVVKATTADRKKGETYVVHDGEKIVTYNKKRLDGLKRASAKEIAATHEGWQVASSLWASDNGIK